MASSSSDQLAGSESDFLTPDGQYRIECSEMGLLGSGAHGVVRIAQHVQTMAYVAVKITPMSVVRSSCKEMTALARLSSPYIVELLGVQVDMHQGKVYVIMELCQGGELFDRIAECGGLPEEDARRYFVQVLCALRHCHQNGVFHRDLKPENILLDEEDNAKVADFGLAAVYRHVLDDASFLQHTKVGSVMYAAPEVLVSTASAGYDAARADMWSLGVILFSMLSGTLPFECAAASRCQRYASVLRNGIQVMCPEQLSAQVTSLLSRLLHPEPSQRYTADEALNCDWLRSAAADHAAELSTRPVERTAGELSLARCWTIMFRVDEQQVASLPSAQATALRADQGAGDQEAAPVDVPTGAAAAATTAMDAVMAMVPGSPRKRTLDGDEDELSEVSSQPQRPRQEPPPDYLALASRGAQPQPSSSTASAASAQGSDERVQGLPLQSCLSQFVNQFGWEPLPTGTEQLLRDIFDTLRSMGLRYTLQEQQDDASERSPAPQRGGPRQRALILRIDFDAEHTRPRVVDDGGELGGGGL